MAAESKLKKISPIAWASFVPPGARRHANSQVESAIVADGQTRLWLGEHAGIPVIVVEDSTFPSPARIPLSACNGYGE